MTNKLCDLEKLCGKSTKIGNTPLLYNTCSRILWKKHITQFEYLKGNLPTGFPFLYS